MVPLTLALLILVFCGYGTWRRNQVWRSEATLWRDVTLKSPANGRGLMNYGLTLLAAGKPEAALDYFQRALVYTPNYYLLEVNLGAAHAALRHEAEAEAHFQRALELGLPNPQPSLYYAGWLYSRGRNEEALINAQTALALNPTDPAAQRLAESIRARIPGFLTPVDRAEAAVAVDRSADNFLELSLRYYETGRYDDCIRMARESLGRRPDYAEAWNNVAAGHQALGQWDEAIAAAREALRLKPDFPLARNNLEFSEMQKAEATKHGH